MVEKIFDEMVMDDTQDMEEKEVEQLDEPHPQVDPPRVTKRM